MNETPKSFQRLESVPRRAADASELLVSANARTSGATRSRVRIDMASPTVLHALGVCTTCLTESFTVAAMEAAFIVRCLAHWASGREAEADGQRTRACLLACLLCARLEIPNGVCWW